MKYYVYAYIRTDGTPYYIGKGTGKRAWNKSKGEIQKPSTNTRIVILERNVTLTGSLAIERRLIRWYGRIDTNSGILRNKTDGGEGGCGTRRAAMSEETKHKISKSNFGKILGPRSETDKKKISESMQGKNLGKIRTVEQKSAQSIRQTGKVKKPHADITKQKISDSLKGRSTGPMSQEQKEKISLALTGKQRTEEHSKKLSIALRGRTPGTIERENYLKAMEAGKSECKHCGKVITKGNYIRWHGDNCKKLLSGEDPFSKN